MGEWFQKTAFQTSSFWESVPAAPAFPDSTDAYDVHSFQTSAFQEIPAAIPVQLAYPDSADAYPGLLFPASIQAELNDLDPLAGRRNREDFFIDEGGNLHPGEQLIVAAY